MNKKISRAGLFVLCAAFLLFSVSCDGKKELRSSVSNGLYVYEEAAEEVFMDDFSAAPALMSSKRAQTPSPVMAKSLAAGSAEFDIAAAEPESDAAERKLVKNGSISAEVENLAAADSYVEAWASFYGGYIFSSGCSTTNAWYTVKIPAARFDEAMNKASDMGIIKSKSVYTEDVSDSWYDLQGRLSTRRIMQERLTEYLKQASNVEDLMRIESELNSVITDIEYMEGRMKQLNGRIEYSTVNINVNLPYRTDNEGGFKWPDMGEQFRFFFSDTVDFFADFFITLLYIVVMGVPVIAAVVLFYWLLFGKVGILVRIFKKISRPKSKKSGSSKEEM